MIRLPAELRNCIWAYAYGNAVVHVHLSDFGLRHSRHGVLYSICDSDDDPRTIISCCYFPSNKPASVPLISKQIWYEVTGTFMTTNMFTLNCHFTFYAFALLRRESVSRLSKLLIRLSGPIRYEDEWSKVLTSSILGRFKNLQGVNLVVQVDPTDSEAGMCMGISWDGERLFHHLERSIIVLHRRLGRLRLQSVRDRSSLIY
jgi:hypothetical protein